MSKAIQIFSFADVDRSGKVRWTACELGYEIEETRLELGEHQGEDYLRLNPYAQVPTATIDGKNFIESSAICVLMAERHPEAGLIPTDLEQREVFWQQVSVAVTSLETPVVNYFLASRGIMDERWKSMLEDSLKPRIETFVSTMPTSGYLAGDFSLADIFAAYVLRVAIQGGVLINDGVLADYLDRLRARPAAAASRMFDSLDA